jgi:hypothetical protein
MLSMSLNANYQLKAEIELKIDKKRSQPASFVVYNSRIYRRQPPASSSTATAAVRFLVSLANPFAFFLWLTLLLVTVSALLVQPVNANLLSNIPRQIDSPSSTTIAAAAAAASTSYHPACPDYSDIELVYDKGLFAELNMHDTLINLYRSCYKEKFDESLKNTAFKSGLLGPCSETKRARNSTRSGGNASSSTSSSSTKSRFTTKPSPTAPNAGDILLELWMDKQFSIIPIDIRNRIDLVCRRHSPDGNKTDFHYSL